MTTPASEANCTLQVAGVAPSVTEAALLNMFRIYGPILRTASTSYGSAYVTHHSVGRVATTDANVRSSKRTIVVLYIG